MIVKYGLVFRGLKVKRAQELGALGVIMYSDPGDDYGITPEEGYDEYPEGPARHHQSVQRGSVEYLSFGPGEYASFLFHVIYPISAELSLTIQ